MLALKDEVAGKLQEFKRDVRKMVDDRETGIDKK
jgi:hypothetical protein